MNTVTDCHTEKPTAAHISKSLQFYSSHRTCNQKQRRHKACRPYVMVGIPAGERILTISLAVTDRTEMPISWYTLTFNVITTFKQPSIITSHNIMNSAMFIGLVYYVCIQMNNIPSLFYICVCDSRCQTNPHLCSYMLALYTKTRQSDCDYRCFETSIDPFKADTY